MSLQVPEQTCNFCQFRRNVFKVACHAHKYLGLYIEETLRGDKMIILTHTNSQARLK